MEEAQNELFRIHTADPEGGLESLEPNLEAEEASDQLVRATRMFVRHAPGARQFEDDDGNRYVIVHMDDPSTVLFSRARDAELPYEGDVLALRPMRKANLGGDARARRVRLESYDDAPLSYLTGKSRGVPKRLRASLTWLD